MVIGN